MRAKKGGLRRAEVKSDAGRIMGARREKERARKRQGSPWIVVVNHGVSGSLISVAESYVIFSPLFEVRCASTIAQRGLGLDVYRCE